MGERVFCDRKSEQVKLARDKMKIIGITSSFCYFTDGVLGWMAGDPWLDLSCSLLPRIFLLHAMCCRVNVIVREYWMISFPNRFSRDPMFPVIDTYKSDPL